MKREGSLSQKGRDALKPKNGVIYGAATHEGLMKSKVRKAMETHGNQARSGRITTKVLAKKGEEPKNWKGKRQPTGCQKKMATPFHGKVSWVDL